MRKSRGRWSEPAGPVVRQVPGPAGRLRSSTCREAAVPGSPRFLSSRRLAWALCAALLGVPSSRADEFSRIVGPPLFEVPRTFEARKARRLSLRAIEALPEVLRGERSALIVATTDQGHLAKLLVTQGLRKPASAGPAPKMAPVLVVERYETIDAGDRVSRKARGRDILLFDRFEFDLDTGQVVPPGYGGDVAFSTEGRDGPGLAALGGNALYPIDKPFSVPGAEPGRPSEGRVVLPTDFNGRYTLISNGQMSGALELSVAADGAVSGRFRSDRNGSMYPVTGKVADDMPRRIEFEVQFPRSRQAFDGLLWTEDKNVFAGTVQIQGHPYSFIAVREGMPLYPEPIDATGPPRAPSAPKTSTRVIALEGTDRFRLDGASKSEPELTAALRAAGQAGTPIEVLIRVPPMTTFERVQRAVGSVRAAGVSTIRFAASETP